MQNVDRKMDIPSCHVVGIRVIVDVFMPFVGANHVIDYVIITFWMPFDAAGPELCGTEHDLCPILTHKFVVTGHMPVLPDGVDDTGRDMQFEGAIEYCDQFAAFGMDNSIGCGFPAIQGTFPGELRPFIA